MQREPRSEKLRAEGCAQIIERRVFKARQTCDKRHKPVAALEQMLYRTNGLAFIGFPGVVPDQADGQPDKAQQKQKIGFGAFAYAGLGRCKTCLPVVFEFKRHVSAVVSSIRWIFYGKRKTKRQP